MQPFSYTHVASSLPHYQSQSILKSPQKPRDEPERAQAAWRLPWRQPEARIPSGAVPNMPGQAVPGRPQIAGGAERATLVVILGTARDCMWITFMPT